jgi:hypothetical protein
MPNFFISQIQKNKETWKRETMMSKSGSAVDFAFRVC